MSMQSWPAYESYSGSLGIQTLTDILYTDYGPNPASQNNNGWGMWTPADHTSIGMDRTVWNGTGFSGQYPPEISSMYESIETLDDSLLWFHHVPNSQKFRSGKTVIQHFYDAHYTGAATAQTFPTKWESLKDKIDEERYEHILYRLMYQAGHSIIWRDAISAFYHNLSSIPDEAGRVGPENHPWRIEAENMDLARYIPYAVSPFETASNATAIVTTSNTIAGTASTRINFPTGKYDIAVNYYDVIRGVSHWKLFINDKQTGEWNGDHECTLGHAPSVYLDSHPASRVTFRGISVQKGDILRIWGQSDGIEQAALDYVVFLPEGGN